MTLVKALIEILDEEVIDLGKGLLPFIPVQFNPTEYALSKGAQIADIAIPGIDSPLGVKEWTHHQPRPGSC